MGQKVGKGYGGRGGGVGLVRIVIKEYEVIFYCDEGNGFINRINGKVVEYLIYIDIEKYNRDGE